MVKTVWGNLRLSPNCAGSALLTGGVELKVVLQKRPVISNAASVALDNRHISEVIDACYVSREAPKPNSN